MLRLECAPLGRDEVEHHVDEDADKSKVTKIDVANEDGPSKIEDGIVAWVGTAGVLVPLAIVV